MTTSSVYGLDARIVAQSRALAHACGTVLLFGQDRSFSEAEIERPGQTFMKLDQRMEELKKAFDLENEDLNLNLGPLGDLM